MEAQFCMHCGTATPPDTGVPPRMMPTGAVEVEKVRRVLGTRFRVERILGEGGMATVYLAEDLKHRRRVAVKVMRPELAATLGSERFLREVEIAAQLSHPHILPMHDSGEAEGLLFYVMPYVEGESLAARLARETQLPVQDAVRIAREVAEALAYAHKRGIVHRDIKPANILLAEGHAMVADFGIARALGNEAVQLTGTGMAIGTPQYMSPEQATGGREVDGRTDVYALGSVLYEMVAGEPPFTGPNAQAVISRSLTETPRPLTSTRQGLPGGLEAVVARSLAKNPADRYAGADEMAAALTGVQQGTASGSSPSVAAAAAPVGKTWLAFGAVAIIALVALAFMTGRWGLPSWFLFLAAGLIAAGAVVLALTARTEARRRDGRTVGGVLGWLNWRNAALGGVLALALWAVAATVYAARSPAVARAEGVHLAILPFENQGADDDAYFAEGIADEVRGKLSRIDGITLIASSSSDQYRASTKSSQDVARELGADYLLVGRVRWAGSGDGRRVQVVPELVDGRTGSTTWQQGFDAGLSDVFQMQAQIAGRVASALGRQLGTTEQRRVDQRSTSNLAAWNVYQRGRALTSVDPRTSREAASYYEQAVALDSGFVEAWSALAVALSRVYSNGRRDATVAARSKEAMQEALRLAPDGPASNAAALRYYLIVEGDTARARQAAERALGAAPRDPEVLSLAAGIDRQSGHLEQAAEKLERAREIDPRSPTNVNILVQVYTQLHRWDDAIEAAETARSLAPGDANMVEWLVIPHLAQGHLDQARTIVRAAIDGGLTPPEVAAFFAGYQELSWALPPAEQDLLFRLTPAVFDDDRAWWGQSLATAYWQRGDRERAGIYADSALAESKAQLEASPTTPSFARCMV